MNLPNNLTLYDRTKDYAWNYQHAPEPVSVDIPDWPDDCTFCGLPVGSPLGVPAGPLLNGRWCLYYASLGFDVVTYKTVRSSERACYPLPNLQPVECGQLLGDETELPASDNMQGSWAVSYGMPSSAPDIWRADIERTRNQLPSGKLLSVSVVGTVQDGWSTEDLARDYALCAKWALESGADVVETNFSCPNVSTCDGQLYQVPDDAAVVAECVRQAIGSTPYIIKIGHANCDEDATALLGAVAKHANALAMTNSIATTVKDDSGQLLFDGAKRGICGAATRDASIDQTRRFANLVRQHQHDVKLIGVGGVTDSEHVTNYLNAGAHAVHIATAAMVNPAIALKIRASKAP